MFLSAQIMGNRVLLKSCMEEKVWEHFDEGGTNFITKEALHTDRL